MKSTTTISKDLNYSLYNLENYKKELNVSINEIIKKYLNLVVEYYKFIIENIKIKNKYYSQFIIIRGLDTITHVFLNLLLYTKNIDLTYFNCQKSFYFYIEFVCQITEDENKFLQLTSRDASTYVYKKTIFEIKPEFKKLNEDMSESTREIFKTINICTSLYKKYLLKIIEKSDFSKNDAFIHSIEETLSKINFNLIKIDKLTLYNDVIDKLLNNIDDLTRILEINKYIVKKFTKNDNILYNCKSKINTEDFITKINNETTENLSNWLLSSSIA